MRPGHVVKFAGEVLFVVSLVWFIVVSDAASVHKLLFGGMLLCGAGMGILQHAGRRTITALPVWVASGLVRWARSWIAEHRGPADPVSEVHPIHEEKVAPRQGRQFFLPIGARATRLALPSSTASHPAVPATITVRLFFFAQYRALAGTGEVVVKVPEPVSVADLVDHLRTGAGLSKLPARPVVTVNMDYVSLATELCDGDEVAFIPPAAGS